MILYKCCSQCCIRCSEDTVSKYYRVSDFKQTSLDQPRVASKTNQRKSTNCEGILPSAKCSKISVKKTRYITDLRFIPTKVQCYFSGAFLLKRNAQTASNHYNLFQRLPLPLRLPTKSASTFTKGHQWRNEWSKTGY